MVGLKGMLVQFRDLKKYWNVDKIDWVSEIESKDSPSAGLLMYGIMS